MAVKRKKLKILASHYCKDFVLFKFVVKYEFHIHCRITLTLLLHAQHASQSLFHLSTYSIR